ncbi:hypothetical protein D3C86_1547320 [compost metagenome]
MLGDPAFKIRPVRARDLVVMKRVVHALTVQPDARLLHRVTGLDAVQGDGHGGAPRVVRCAIWHWEAEGSNSDPPPAPRVAVR